MANINLLQTVTYFTFVSEYYPSCRIQRKTRGFEKYVCYRPQIKGWQDIY